MHPFFIVASAIKSKQYQNRKVWLFCFKILVLNLKKAKILNSNEDLIWRGKASHHSTVVKKSDLGFGKVIPSCMSYMRLAQRCPRALSSHSQVPIPRAQRVADRVHLTTSFPPRRLELATRRSAVRRVTDRATREGFL